MFYVFVIANVQNLASEIFGVIGSLGENSIFLVPYGLTFKDILIAEPQGSRSTHFKTISQQEKNLYMVEKQQRFQNVVYLC